MNVPLQEWGRRLSDALRDALDSKDFASARRLAVEGDGQARSLAKEYALMYRGLGITIRALLHLIGETVRRADASNSKPAAKDAALLVHRFQSEYAGIMARVWGAPTLNVEAQAKLDEELARAAAMLKSGEERFEREQNRLADEFLQALEANDIARAREILDTKEPGQYVLLHDRLIRFMAESFGWVLRWFGPDGLLRFHMDTAQAQRQGFDKWEQLEPAEFAHVAAFLLKQHMGQLTVREDEEKFTIEQSLCGSGGKLRLIGAYEGPDALPFVETPGPLTFGQPCLPVYCSHCPVWNGVAPLKWYGRPHWIFENASRTDGGCTLHVYKRRDGAPAEYAAIMRGETTKK